jgi:hypothetical protein
MSRQKWLACTCIVCLLVIITSGSYTGATVAQNASQYFPETGHTVKGRFLTYWKSHGGLAQQGYPLSEEFQETSDLDHKLYTVQYFERAVFEYHPEYAGTPYEVLLSQLGVFEYHQRYAQAQDYSPPPPPIPGQPAPPPLPFEQQHPNTDHPRFFPETGRTLGGKFRFYWENHGGLAQQGYPISNEFQEKSTLNGKTYTVQYFERAVFEYHSEQAGTQYEVLLAQLGSFRYQARYSTRPLTIPGPSAPGRTQSFPKGSEGYLVWSEQSVSEPETYTPPNADILGLELGTGRVLTVTNAPGEQTNPAISGSLVVWEDGDPTYHTETHNVLGKDLATGSNFVVAAGAADQWMPAISGRTVAWVEGRIPPMRVLLKNLDNGATTVVEALPGDRYIIRPPVMNERYLAWAEATWGSRDGLPFRLQVLDRRTGSVSTVLQTGPVHDQTVPLTFALVNRSLAESLPFNGTSRLALDEQTSLLSLSYECGGMASNPAIIVWSDCMAIRGMRPTDTRPLWLVTTPGAHQHPALAGSWLVWEDSSGPNAGHLESVPLSAALSGQANPPFPLSPTPVPTPLPVSANLSGISIFAVDEGQAVGDRGAQLFWDGGDRWQPMRSSTDRNLTAIDMLPTDSGSAPGWAAGDGVILRVMGIGPGTTPIAAPGQLNGVETLAIDDAWAVGGSNGTPLVMHYTGEMWNTVSLPFTGYSLNGVDMVSPTEGWAVGDGPALHYDMGTWTEVALPVRVRLNGISMAGPAEGWAVGDGGTILHYQAGRWETAPSPVHTDLHAVSFRGSTEGWAVGDAGTILHYSAGVWTVSPSPTLANLRGLQRHLEIAVAAVGEGGVVLRYSGESGWVQEQARPYPSPVP